MNTKTSMIRSLVTEGWSDGIASRRYFAYLIECQEDADAEKAHPLRFKLVQHANFYLPVVMEVSDRINFAARSLVCRFRDHDWEDDSYGGPDSGCMAGHCKRCGYSFHTTLY